MTRYLLAGVAAVLATYLLVRALFRDATPAGLDPRVLALLVALLQTPAAQELMPGGELSE